MTNPSETLVSSASNPAVKLARALAERRRVRYRERAFLAEGVRVLESLIDVPLQLRVLFIDNARRAELAADVHQKLLDAAERVLFVESDIFHMIADTEAPQPVLGVVNMPVRRVLEDCTMAIALDGIRDPGNLGTIIRSAVAANVDVIGLLPGTTDPYGPKAVRASAGLIGRAPLRPIDDLALFLNSSFQAQPAVILADASAKQAYDDVDWTEPFCLVIGGETAGFASVERGLATRRVRIPMADYVESLNAGVAAAVVLFEAARQRR